MRTVTLATLGSLLAFSGVADAALTLHTSAFVTSPIASSDLEDLPSNPVINSVFPTGGLTIQYVDQSTVFDGSSTGVNDFDLGGDGANGWYALDFNGYTALKLADGSAFNQFEFRASSGGNGGPVQYSLWNAGSEVANGLIGNVPSPFSPGGSADLSVDFSTLGFSGVSFDEVRLRLDRDATSFMLTDEDVLILDDFKVGRVSVDAVPEPATWAMMIAGFGIVGAAVRRRDATFRKPAGKSLPA